MTIDRHNYEEFFILYLDNELTQEERRAVEQFAAENADLGQELEMLMQTKLVPDSEVVFDNKDELMRFAGDPSITAGNYEEWLVLYIDNELTPAQKQAVEAFAASNPDIQRELELLQQTKLQPEEHVIFPDKSLLYRQEETRRRPVVAIRWWRIAAAAAVLTAVSATAWVMLNNNSATEGVASAQKTEQKVMPAPVQSTPTIPGNEEMPAVAVVPEQSPALASNNEEKKTIEKKIAAPRINNVVEEVKAQNVIAKNDNGNRNNLPQPKNNPYIKNDQPIDNQIAYEPVNKSANETALTFPKVNTQVPVVTNNSAQPSDLTTTASVKAGATEEATPEFAVNESGKKNKLRGFFRKVTRTFEKTTNMKATDEDDRLLVGSLAIKL